MQWESVRPPSFKHWVVELLSMLLASSLIPVSSFLINSLSASAVFPPLFASLSCQLCHFMFSPSSAFSPLCTNPSVFPDVCCTF